MQVRREVPPTNKWTLVRTKRTHPQVYLRDIEIYRERVGRENHRQRQFDFARNVELLRIVERPALSPDCACISCFSFTKQSTTTERYCYWTHRPIGIPVLAHVSHRSYPADEKRPGAGYVALTENRTDSRENQEVTYERSQTSGTSRFQSRKVIEGNRRTTSPHSP